MINQVTNLIQWKNLTPEQQAEFDFEDYEYEAMAPLSTIWVSALTQPITPHDHTIYRLKIQPEKWYYIKFDSPNSVDSYTLRGSDDLIKEPFISIIRPATKDEIPNICNGDGCEKTTVKDYNYCPECYEVLKRPVTLESRIKAEFPDKRVVMTGPVNWHGVDFIGFKRGEKHWSTFEAQGMVNFVGYIYEGLESGLCQRLSPIIPLNVKGPILHPVAVLFSVQS